jgi:carbamate kinase
MARIVLALGGNALGETAEEQLKRAEVAAQAIADLIEQGHDVLLVHGNGPQVGQIRLAFEEASKSGKVPLIPFAECSAMSQGYIGYHLQQTIDEELVKRGHADIPVVTMLTQTVVSPNDPAFEHPTKPIGGFYSEEEAKELMAKTGDTYIEDSGRGWRRVVPSPQPIDIYEKMSLRALVAAHQVVIAAGGGGIPVVYHGDRYHGVDAVIDKDLAAAKVAQLVDANAFIILTAVDRVCINFGKPDQKEIEQMSVREAEDYIKADQFGKGSMEPKVKAACNFVKSAPLSQAIIASLDKAADAVKGLSGTRIVA